MLLAIKAKIDSDRKPGLFYFRTASGKEVDFILESRDGKLTGIEVKFSESVQNKDFEGLRELSKLTGKRFKSGYVLYTGNRVVPFGENLFTLPLSAFPGIK
ncbi:MAG: DUF4143 domain-containing protein [Calditrichaeota bacterium]|nr:DUF4143 domain-containing protein [Calditrichota bacterium]